MGLVMARDLYCFLYTYGPGVGKAFGGRRTDAEHLQLANSTKQLNPPLSSTHVSASADANRKAAIVAARRMLGKVKRYSLT